jgi:3-hydroxyisobutyrate dehydrogenase-like beta-hydroxyacid dehydrogenase
MADPTFAESAPGRYDSANNSIQKRYVMSITVAIMAQGSMGSGVGKRLHESGAEVRTLIGGRSAGSAERARAAGMKPMADERAMLDGADFFLSILPPGEAENLARRLAPALSALAKKPIYVDCNAVSPQTAQRVAAIVEPTGASFVDGGIIGGPPRPGYSGPAIYASGPAVDATRVLRDWGLDWRAIDGPIGAASGLKMSYAGITKGITALGSAMMLGAARFGCAEALVAELSSSQPQIFKYLSASIPRMYDKAYRWVAEMEEISDFHGPYKPAADIYAAIARHYAALAAAEAEPAPGPDNPIKTLDRVLGRGNA